MEQQPTGWSRGAQAVVAVALAAPLVCGAWWFGYQLVATIADWGWVVPGATQAVANGFVALGVALVWAALTSAVVGVRRVRAFLADEAGRPALVRWTLFHMVVSALLLAASAAYASVWDGALALAGGVVVAAMVARRRG
jgi:hypothetical protein